MKWLKRSGLALGILLLILAVVPFFISLNDYIPEIEKAASERLKEPVKIGKLSLALLPMPHLTVDDITVGKAQDLTVGKVTATPALSSLFGTPKIIRSLEIDKLVLTQAGLDKIPLWMKPDKPDEPAAVVIQSIKLDDATLKLAKTTFGPFDARLAMTDDGLESASIVGRDGKLKAFVKPEGKDRYVIEANARGWTVPVGPAVLFEELSVKGTATLKNASFDDIRAKLYGGTAAGKAAIDWTKGFQLKGNLEVSQIEVKPLLQAIGRPASVSGRLTARPAFSARAASVDQIPAVLRLETPFEVHGGVLHGMDIGKAATVLVGTREGAKGGETRFDRLSGHLVLERGTRRLTKLNIASGSLSADGNVTISPRDELSGRVNAKVSAASVASATVPLNVSGTVQSPILLPTGASVAGAALGTAVAGPLGTAAGSKIGQWAEGLFGGGDSSKKK
jgi:uncharacterized protein involved in outer membrane biogenesis